MHGGDWGQSWGDSLQRSHRLLAGIWTTTCCENTSTDRTALLCQYKKHTIISKLQTSLQAQNKYTIIYKWHTTTMSLYTRMRCACCCCCCVCMCVACVLCVDGLTWSAETCIVEVPNRLWKTGIHGKLSYTKLKRDNTPSVNVGYIYWSLSTSPVARDVDEWWRAVRTAFDVYVRRSMLRAHTLCAWFIEALTLRWPAEQNMHRACHKKHVSLDECLSF